jgi:cyclic pyranopterin phosphate synthase
MTLGEVIRWLERGRRQGADSLWLGGGEPTLRRDLWRMIEAARRLGYARIRVQTNGLMLAYPEYLDRLVTAGLSEVNFSVKGANAELHDSLCGRKGAFTLLIQGIANARSRGLSLEADVLVCQSNLRHQAEIVRFFAAAGLQGFTWWILSTADSAATELRAEVPRFVDLVPELVAAIEAGREAGVKALWSLHTPPCVLPAPCRVHLLPAAELDLLVVNPGGHAFMLQDSAMEKGAFLEGCAGCALRPRCIGIRPEYLAIHGSGEFRPVSDPARPGG